MKTLLVALSLFSVAAWAEYPKIFDRGTYRPMTEAEYLTFSGGTLSNGVVILPPVEAPSPQVFPDGIELPVLILSTTSPEKGVGIVADPANLDLIVYLDHESPRDPAAIAARIAAEKAKRDLLRLDLRGVRTNLIAVIDMTNTNVLDCQAIKAATTNVTNAAQGKQISDLAGEAVDTNRRLKDLAQELQNLRAIVRDLLKGSD